MESDASWCRRYIIFREDNSKMQIGRWGYKKINIKIKIQNNKIKIQDDAI